jgi:hypothetical protein
MVCRICASERQEAFPSEVNIHPPHGLEYLTGPCVFAFPQLLVCLDCGFTEFVLEETECSELAQRHGVERLGTEKPNEEDVSRVWRTAASKLN